MDTQIRLSQVAEIEVSYRPKFKASERPRITCSKDCYEILLQQWDHNKLELLEQFKIMLLNRGNKVLGIMNVSTGGVSGTIADPKLIFATALKATASGIILSHNHPSGQLKPSQADINLTKKLKDGGALLDIAVLDHLIVTSESYYSFADEGLL
ncbi:JAB domain-containing protein [Desertivirga xinjiangensis]|uniref:JAB domain-containing protein n=1 Tax=Desertivirga xinjiangensis TaxID=539206 RepID=UPI00210E9046|nr:JAB domain-containing protein [Pedobacter xinjiangensis]